MYTYTYITGETGHSSYVFIERLVFQNVNITIEWMHRSDAQNAWTTNDQQNTISNCASIIKVSDSSLFVIFLALPLNSSTLSI